MKDIYVVFSHTPYKIGRFIRAFTREEYNHVSVMFDDNMAESYTFGRKHIDTPFLGGLIKDSVSRYSYKNHIATVTVCKVQVEDERFDLCLKTAREMFDNNNLYIYNLLSAAVSLTKKKILIKDSYTCVEFCTYLLSLMCDEVDNNKFYSVGDLLKVFEDKQIYKGVFNITGEEDEIFNTKKGFPYAAKNTAKNFFELFRRIRNA